MEKQLRVGVISSTHGIRGEVKVFPTTDDVKRFKKLKKFIWIQEKSRFPWKLNRSGFLSSLRF